MLTRFGSDHIGPIDELREVVFWRGGEILSCLLRVPGCLVPIFSLTRRVGFRVMCWGNYFLFGNALIRCALNLISSIWKYVHEIESRSWDWEASPLLWRRKKSIWEIFNKLHIFYLYTVFTLWNSTDELFKINSKTNQIHWKKSLTSNNSLALDLSISRCILNLTDRLTYISILLSSFFLLLPHVFIHIMMGDYLKKKEEFCLGRSDPLEEVVDIALRNTHPAWSFMFRSMFSRDSLVNTRSIYSLSNRYIALREHCFMWQFQVVTCKVFIKIPRIFDRLGCYSQSLYSKGEVHAHLFLLSSIPIPFG